MSKYPRIGETVKRKKNNCAKCRCGEVAKFKVHIQLDYMRGNDEVIWSCESHKKDVGYLLEWENAK